jgi:hypothetical protein
MVTAISILASGWYRTALIVLRYHTAKDHLATASVEVDGERP